MRNLIRKIMIDRNYEASLHRFLEEEALVSPTMLKHRDTVYSINPYIGKLECITNALEVRLSWFFEFWENGYRYLDLLQKEWTGPIVIKRKDFNWVLRYLVNGVCAETQTAIAERAGFLPQVFNRLINSDETMNIRLGTLDKILTSMDIRLSEFFFLVETHSIGSDEYWVMIDKLNERKNIC